MEDISLPQIESKNGEMNYELHFVSKFLTKLFVRKTNQWKHKGNCVINSLKGFIKNFTIAYWIKIGFQLLMMLVKGKISLLKMFKNIKSYDSLGFALFLAGLSGIFKIALCIARRFNSVDQKYNAILAGILSSLAWLADRNTSRRQAVIFYLSSRVLQSSLKLLDSHKVMKEPKEFGFYIMAIGSGFFAYQFWCEKDTAIKSLLKTCDKFGFMSANDRIYADIFHKTAY